MQVEAETAGKKEAPAAWTRTAAAASEPQEYPAPPAAAETSLATVEAEVERSVSESLLILAAEKKRSVGK